MDMNEPFPAEISQAINEFVDQIERVLLQNGMPRAERTSVCAEVEAQIHTMIERRLEAGAELNLELVHGIIESMDQPESYAKPLDASHLPKPALESAQADAATPIHQVASKVESIWQSIKKTWARSARTKPGLDWVAVAGLAPTCLGVFCILAGMPRRNEFAIVSGFFWIFVGVVLSGISFWRIRHSNGLLTGQRIAAVGVMILPIALANIVLFAILFTTPIGRILGAIILVAGAMYANYRMIKYALHWLDSYSATVPAPVVAPTEPVVSPAADSGPISGMIVTS